MLQKISFGIKTELKAIKLLFPNGMKWNVACRDESKC